MYLRFTFAALPESTEIGKLMFILICSSNPIESNIETNRIKCFPVHLLPIRESRRVFDCPLPLELHPISDCPITCGSRCLSLSLHLSLFLFRRLCWSAALLVFAMLLACVLLLISALFFSLSLSLTPCPSPFRGVSSSLRIAKMFFWLLCACIPTQNANKTTIAGKKTFSIGSLQFSCARSICSISFHSLFFSRSTQSCTELPAVRLFNPMTDPFRKK